MTRSTGSTPAHRTNSDLWRISHHEAGLDDLIDTVISTALPGHRYRTTPATHPRSTCL